MFSERSHNQLLKGLFARIERCPNSREGGAPMKGVASLLLLTVCAWGCVARNRVNPNCRWTNDSSMRLDVGRSADVWHLMNDAMVAEDVAIRYADATKGRGSGHFSGWDEYESMR